MFPPFQLDCDEKRDILKKVEESYGQSVKELSDYLKLKTQYLHSLRL